MRSSRRPEDAANRQAWKRDYYRSPKGVLYRFLENEARRKRRQAAREAARAARTPELELAALIDEQARDARTYRVKHGPDFLDASPVSWAA